DAFRFLATERVLVSQLTEQLKARREELPERVAALVTRVREAERELQRVRSAQVLSAAAGLAGAAQDVAGVAFVAHRVPDGTTADGIRKLAIDVRDRLGRRPAVVMVAGIPADRPVVVVAVSDHARERGVKAGPLVQAAARQLGGGGGGRDDIAQGGGAALGDNAARGIDQSFEAVRSVVRDMTGEVA
ncbi:MAG: alanine--tRNA ligase, partial [Actinobacteria bacterium]|nr:alanine--tRNA ligase [Actinomycetota bacterium]